MVAFRFFALTVDLIHCRFHMWAKLLLIARKYSASAEFPSARRAVSSIVSRGIYKAFEIKVLIRRSYEVSCRSLRGRGGGAGTFTLGRKARLQ